MRGGFYIPIFPDSRGDKDDLKFIHCRLDFFLANQSTFCNINEADIIPGYKTDHSMNSLFFSVYSNARGRGFWKLNTFFLKETEYVSQIKSTIQKTKEEYANDDSVDPSLVWEMVNLKVRGSSINFGIKKKKKMASEQNEIQQSIAILEKRISDASVDDSQKQNLWVQLETKKQELERIVEYQTKGAILRSKSRWYNEGERNTKYFLNLEKRHCKQVKRR